MPDTFYLGASGLVEIMPRIWAKPGAFEKFCAILTGSAPVFMEKPTE